MRANMMNLDFVKFSISLQIAVLYLKTRILNHAVAAIGCETWFLCLKEYEQPDSHRCAAEFLIAGVIFPFLCSTKLH
jgi:hypothetical protein